MGMGTSDISYSQIAECRKEVKIPTEKRMWLEDKCNSNPPTLEGLHYGKKGW